MIGQFLKKRAMDSDLFLAFYLQYMRLRRQRLARQARRTDPRQLIEQQHEQKFGTKPNLQNPRTFNEKIHWRKLHQDHPLFAIGSDKAAVRQYVAETIGEEYLIPLAQIAEKPEDIRFEELPESFIMKNTDDSGSSVLVRDKNEWTADRLIRAARIMRARPPMYLFNRVRQYRSIPRKTIIEYLLHHDDQLPEDYKIHVFNGRVGFIQVASPQKDSNGIYDVHWQRMGFEYHNPHLYEYERPQNLEHMLELALKLAEPLDYVRVDLYNIRGNIYFGELSMTSNGGLGWFRPAEYDLFWGEQWTLAR